MRLLFVVFTVVGVVIVVVVVAVAAAAVGMYVKNTSLPKLQDLPHEWFEEYST